LACLTSSSFTTSSITCSTCFEGVILSWTPYTSSVPSKNTTSWLLMILLFLHTSSNMFWSFHNTLKTHKAWI
jgi:hypothetical protein